MPNSPLRRDCTARGDTGDEQSDFGVMECEDSNGSHDLADGCRGTHGGFRTLGARDRCDGDPSDRRLSLCATHSPARDVGLLADLLPGQLPRRSRRARDVLAETTETGYVVSMFRSTGWTTTARSWPGRWTPKVGARKQLVQASQPSTVSPGSVVQVSLPPWPRTRSFPRPSTEFSVSFPSRPLSWSASLPPTAESLP